MLTELFRGQKSLEARRSPAEKVTVVAGTATLFPDLSEAADGANCYNFLRRIRERPDSAVQWNLTWLNPSFIHPRCIR
jgi:hypothetical protein